MLYSAECNRKTQFSPGWRANQPAATNYVKNVIQFYQTSTKSISAVTAFIHLHLSAQLRSLVAHTAFFKMSATQSAVRSFKMQLCQSVTSHNCPVLLSLPVVGVTDEPLKVWVCRKVGVLSKVKDKSTSATTEWNINKTGRFISYQMEIRKTKKSYEAEEEQL